MRSNRSSSRGRTTERGFALVWAAGLALLFFMLVSLVLIDSARELAEARRFRARIVANVLAENGAELAAKRIIDAQNTPGTPLLMYEDWQGTINYGMSRNENEFALLGVGETAGIDRTRARVKVTGSIVGNRIRIHFTTHEP